MPSDSPLTNRAHGLLFSFSFADCISNRDANQNNDYAPEHLPEEIRTYNRRVHRDEKYIGSKYRTEKRNDDFQCRAEQ